MKKEAKKISYNLFCKFADVSAPCSSGGPTLCERTPRHTHHHPDTGSDIHSQYQTLLGGVLPKPWLDTGLFMDWAWVSSVWVQATDFYSLCRVGCVFKIFSPAHTSWMPLFSPMRPISNIYNINELATNFTHQYSFRHSPYSLIKPQELLENCVSESFAAPASGECHFWSVDSQNYQLTSLELKLSLTSNCMSLCWSVFMLITDTKTKGWIPSWTMDSVEILSTICTVWLAPWQAW